MVTDNQEFRLAANRNRDAYRRVEEASQAWRLEVLLLLRSEVGEGSLQGVRGGLLFIYLFIYCSYCMQPKEAMADEEKPS